MAFKIPVRVTIFITALIVYLVFIYIKPESTSIGMVDLAMSVVDKGDLYLRYSGASKDVSFFGSNYLLGHFPGTALPVIGIYSIARPFLSGISGYDLLVVIHVLSIIFFAAPCGALIVVVYYSFLRRLGGDGPSSVTLAYLTAFGTMIFGYSTSLYKGTPATLFVFSAFYILFCEKERSVQRVWPFLAVGVLLGSAVITDLAVLYACIIIAFYALYIGKIKSALALTAGFILPIVLLFVYFRAAFGSFFFSPYDFRVNPDPNMITYPRIRNMFSLLFGTLAGFFTYMPVMLLSLWGLVESLRRKKSIPEMIVISAVLVTGALYFSCYVRKGNPYQPAWPHDAHITVRYLLSMCPFMMIPAIFIFKRSSRVLWQVLGGISIFFAYLSAQAGLMPYGGWHLMYAFKVFITGFGMPFIFSDTLPRHMGIETFHTYISRPYVKTAELFSGDGFSLVTDLIIKQAAFFCVFIFVAIAIGTALIRLNKKRV
ncbi:MAG: hypothetical protein P9L88_05540 [Candidatus Tantalella remota]|nr:hypothetical protein [Candidatus Tantalella remota]